MFTAHPLISEQHMNIVLADTEEFRRSRKRAPKSAPGSAAAPVVEADEKRSLGLLIIRGANIISCSVEGPPPADPASRLGGAVPGPAGGVPPVMAAGPGISRPVGRGAGGLQGPAVGVGGPGFGFPPAGGPRKTILRILFGHVANSIYSWFWRTSWIWWQRRTS